MLGPICSKHGISVGATGAEGGSEWVFSVEGPSLGRKQICLSGKENLLFTYLREHESLNLPSVFSSTARASDKTMIKDHMVMQAPLDLPHTFSAYFSY